MPHFELSELIESVLKSVRSSTLKSWLPPIQSNRPYSKAHRIPHHYGVLDCGDDYAALLKDLKALVPLKRESVLIQMILKVPGARAKDFVVARRRALSGAVLIHPSPKKPLPINNLWLSG